MKLELLPQMLLLLLAIEEVEEQPDDDEFDWAKLCMLLLWLLLFVAYNAPPPLPNCVKLVDEAAARAGLKLFCVFVLERAELCEFK